MFSRILNLRNLIFFPLNLSLVFICSKWNFIYETKYITNCANQKANYFKKQCFSKEVCNTGVACSLLKPRPLLQNSLIFYLSSHFLFGSPFSLCNLLPATLLVQAKLDLRNPFFDFLLKERFVSINIRAVGRSENPGVPVLYGRHNRPPWLR